MFSNLILICTWLLLLHVVMQCGVSTQMLQTEVKWILMRHAYVCWILSDEPIGELYQFCPVPLRHFTNRHNPFVFRMIKGHSGQSKGAGPDETKPVSHFPIRGSPSLRPDCLNERDVEDKRGDGSKRRPLQVCPSRLNCCHSLCVCACACWGVHNVFVHCSPSPGNWLWPRHWLWNSTLIVRKMFNWPAGQTNNRQYLISDFAIERSSCQMLLITGWFNRELAA